jgi:hypothetical protein
MSFLLALIINSFRITATRVGSAIVLIASRHRPSGALYLNSLLYSLGAYLTGSSRPK